MDFAYTTNTKSDYSTIVVAGMDQDSNYYVLEIDRFQTSLISEYYRHLFNLYQKWDFRKVICEVTAAQEVIVNDLKQNYIRRQGLPLSIQDFRPNRQMGAKEERINAILQPRYANRSVWHYLGGNCQILEDELILAHPPHDDVKDTLATAIDALVPPPRSAKIISTNRPVQYHAQFGGFI
jgi:phage terminase large subunit-like protein